MDFVISFRLSSRAQSRDLSSAFGSFRMPRPPHRTEQKSTPPLAAHPLGKHAKLGPPSSPPWMVAGQVPRPSSNPPPCETQRNVALARRRSGSPDGSIRAATEAHRTRQLAQRHARQQPSAAISSHPSPHLRHWHFPSKISFSPYTFPLRRIRRRADSTSHPGRLSSQSPAHKELRPWPFLTSG